MKHNFLTAFLMILLALVTTHAIELRNKVYSESVLQIGDMNYKCQLVSIEDH